MNRFIWDMRYQNAHHVPGDESTTGFGSTITGPVAIPGVYQVQLSVNGQTFVQPFEIRVDPRISTTHEDLEAQFDLLMQIRNKLSETHDSVNQLRSIRQQLEGWVLRAEGQGATQGLVESAGEIKEKLAAIEEELIQVPAQSAEQASTGFQAVGPQTGLSQEVKLNAKLASLNVVVAKSDDRPTQQAYEVFDELSRRIDEQLVNLGDVVDRDISTFNDLVREAELPAVVPN